MPSKETVATHKKAIKRMLMDPIKLLFFGIAIKRLVSYIKECNWEDSVYSQTLL